MFHGILGGNCHLVQYYAKSTQISLGRPEENCQCIIHQGCSNFTGYTTPVFSSSSQLISVQFDLGYLRSIEMQMTGNHLVQFPNDMEYGRLMHSHSCHDQVLLVLIPRAPCYVRIKDVHKIKAAGWSTWPQQHAPRHASRLHSLLCRHSFKCGQVHTRALIAYPYMVVNVFYAIMNCGFRESGSLSGLARGVASQYTLWQDWNGQGFPAGT